VFYGTQALFKDRGITAVSRRTKIILMPDRVIATIATLRNRVHERFGERGLFRVCGQLLEIAKVDTRRAVSIGRRYFWLRLLIVLTLAAAGAVVWRVAPLLTSATPASDLSAVLQGIEAAANLTILTGVAIIFLVRLEIRLKRRRALDALHELRSIVHVIDMHQLTKDPSKFIVGGNTPSSPPLELNEFQMTRYLDYCSEMLSLTSKVAVVFGQTLDDPAVAEVVSDIERISAGLSQKIWQKIMILQELRKEAGGLILPDR
jgi:hypothetical protein